MILPQTWTLRSGNMTFFAIDIFEVLNELNVKLQGKALLAHELYMHVKHSKLNCLCFAVILIDFIASQ